MSRGAHVQVTCDWGQRHLWVKVLTCDVRVHSHLHGDRSLGNNVTRTIIRFFRGDQPGVADLHTCSWVRHSGRQTVLRYCDPNLSCDLDVDLYSWHQLSVRTSKKSRRSEDPGFRSCSLIREGFLSLRCEEDLQGEVETDMA